MRFSPNGAAASSPGLRGTSYPGNLRQNHHQPQRGCVIFRSTIGHNPVGVGGSFYVRTQGSPLGAGNPGLEATAPLGLPNSRTRGERSRFVPHYFAVMRRVMYSRRSGIFDLASSSAPLAGAAATMGSVANQYISGRF